MAEEKKRNHYIISDEHKMHTVLYLQELAHKGSEKFIPVFHSFRKKLDLSDNEQSQLFQTWVDERRINANTSKEQ